jgi:hypothetical protein
MAGDVPDYLVRMVRRPAPTTAVIPGTTPVVAFEDPRRAEIATLGINPSLREFHGADGRPLTEKRRRLSTLGSLLAQKNTSESLSRNVLHTFRVIRTGAGLIRLTRCSGKGLAPRSMTAAPAIST